MRNILPVPKQTRERRVTVEEQWPLPAVVVAHHITYDGDPDSYPLHIASKILSDGQSSRIYKKLVYEDGSALAAFGGGNLIEHPNLFYAVAIVQPGHTPEEDTAGLIAELDRLRNEPISSRELQQAKNQFARDYIVGRESVRQKALHLAHAVVLHNGDITTAEGECEIYKGITAQDVQRVAQTYFMGREGRVGRNQDTLGEFNFTEPVELSEGVFGMFNPDLELPGGGSDIVSRKGKTLDRKAFEGMKDEYYRLKGWEVESGLQTRKTLHELSLDFLCKEMEKAGILGTP